MALIVEDGTGKADSESYISVSDADAYHQKFGLSITWLEQPADKKEECLRIATQYLRWKYGHRWLGRKRTVDQALDWPRYSVVDADRFSIPDTVVPLGVRNATAQLALLHLTESNGLMPNTTVNSGLKRKVIQVGSLRKEVEFTSTQPYSSRFISVESSIRHLISEAGTIERG